MEKTLKKAAGKRELLRLAGDKKAKSNPNAFGKDVGVFMACDLTKEEFDNIMKNGGITPDNKHLFYHPYGTKPVDTKIIIP
jgi:hypothetical protein